MDDQDAVIAFLSQGASYGEPGVTPERIQTHISIVFFVGDRAYKLKRAVRFPYLDYSTTALRERYCRAELALNRRTAPTLYRRLRAITRAADGRLAFDGDGVPVDWVVEMRRFAQGDLLDQRADAGSLSAKCMHDLTDVIAAFHERAEITPRHGGRPEIADAVEGNNLNLIRACPPLDRTMVDALYAASRERLATVGALLDARRDRGKVRRCHGDLHLRNVCLLDGRPTPFDCIDFSDAFSCIDVLYDLAFLLMDLLHRGLRDLASLVFNRYLDVTDNSDGLPALPLFLSLRAAVRAHVLIAQPPSGSSSPVLDDARAYLTLAAELLRSRPPRLIAIGGLSGTGKSTMAQALAPAFGPAPGARIARSDSLRKRLFAVAPETRLPPSAYDQSTADRVYRRLEDEASAALAAGYTAIVDATFLREKERKRVVALADRQGVPFTGFWLEAPPEALAARLEARRGDVSDADAAVLRHQLAIDPGAIDWHHVDAAGDVPSSLAAIRAALDADRTDA